ncbi:MAG: integrin alpha [Lysobacterales bacterium]
MLFTTKNTILAMLPVLALCAESLAQVPTQDLLEAATATRGAVVDGDATGDLLGWAVAGDGDYNGDGVNDLVFSSQGFDVVANGATLANAGAVYVLFGGSDALQNLDLSQIPAAGGGDGSQGFVLYGTQTNENLGSALSSAGDINGDGIDDLLIGSPQIPNPLGGGGAYLLFGRPATDPMPAEFDLQTLRTADDSNSGFGVVLEGSQSGGSAGIDVVADLDINGDGIGDIILGNNFSGAGFIARIGVSYVLYGRDASDPWPGRFRLSALQPNLATGSQGFVIISDAAGTGLGSRLANLGDFTGDGVDDLLMGSPSASASDGVTNSAGFIVPGRSPSSGNGAAPTEFDIEGVDLSREEIRATAHQLLGDAAEDLAGEAVAGIGDINGDGRPDLAVTAPLADHGGDNSGSAYVLFGRPVGSALAPRISLANLLPANGGNGSQGFVLTGEAGQRLGDALASAGDINGDGVDDFVVGAKSDNEAGTEAGAVYVVYGRSQGFPASIGVADLVSSGQGMKLLGQAASDKVGDRLALGGDIDRDGNSEILVGSRLVDQVSSNAGRVYVINGEGGAIDGFTGGDSRAWFDAQRSGEGIMIEVGTIDSTPSLFASWYTYQNGEQLWLVAGPVTLEPGQSSVTTDLLQTSGTGFGDNFDPNDVQFAVWGSVTITRQSCDQLRWQYSTQDGAISGEREFVPLLSELLGLTGCVDNDTSKSSTPAVSPAGLTLVPGHAGAWFDPARGGEGILLDLELRGSQPTAFFSWFTYSAGAQRWLVGSAPFDPATGQISDLSLVETRGADFGASFDPDQVISNPWGSVDLSFSGCQGLTVNYSGAFEGGPTQTGSASLVRFTGPLFELNCP